MNLVAANFICVKLEMTSQHATLLIDTGADISVFKENLVSKNQIFYPQQKCTVSGITNEKIQSIGITHTNIEINGMQIPVSFQIVNNDFPIPTDGILGRDFLTLYKCNIDYDNYLLHLKYNDENIMLNIEDNLNGGFIIPQRCEVVRKITQLTTCTEDMLLCSEELYPGVFIGNTIVNSFSPYGKFINTTDKPIYIFNYKPYLSPLKNFDLLHINHNNSIRKEQRQQTIIESLKLKQQSPEIELKLTQLLKAYEDIFHLPGDTLQTNNFYSQSINLADNIPVYVPNYKQIYSQQPEINSQITQMLNDGIIEPSVSHFNSPILLVPKKSETDKKWRLVVDFRQLNKKLMGDKFPLPRIDSILDQLGRAKYFTTLDLMSGFHQIPLEPESRKYTAFSSPTGHYQFTRLPFGLNISPNSFQRMMTIALSGLSPECAFVYVDDIVVIGCSVDHHLLNLQKVFQRIREYNLKLNINKCNFFRSEVTYLGHKISDKGISPDESKYEVIKNFPVPTNADEVRRFVAFCNYYRKFIENFAKIAIPLNKLLRKNEKFNWSQECQDSFETLKQSLLTPTILQYPDFTKEFTLTTDASDYACGAVLSQNYNGVELPIAFTSRSFTKGEANKAVIEKELAAIHWSIQYFKPYLFGRRFKVKTDHRPLVYLFGMKNPSNKLTRMRLDLEEFDFYIEFVQGKQNVVADTLSRICMNSDELKSIFAITRSMANKNNISNGYTDKPTYTMKPDQFKMYHALSPEEARDIPKLIFNLFHTADGSKIYCSVEIKSKNYKKDLLLVKGLEDITDKNEALVRIFKKNRKHYKRI